MDYEHSRELFQEVCRKHIVHFVRVDPRNDIWQGVAPISHDQVKAIMAEANLVWQPEFEDFKVLDNCVYVWPKEFDQDNTWRWGMAFDLVDGYVYMNCF